jgi:hypothetical protein
VPTSLPRAEDAPWHSEIRCADEQYDYEDMKDTWQRHGPHFERCYHIAVASRNGQIMIMKWDNFEPLAHVPARGTREGIRDLKFTPAGCKTPMLAAASHDQHIYVYNIGRGYQCVPCIASTISAHLMRLGCAQTTRWQMSRRLQSMCSGCSGTIEHLDWSYGLIEGPMGLLGRHILQSNDTSREILHWDGLTGKKVTACQKDCLWNTWTCVLGFPVLGIWPDFSNGACNKRIAFCTDVWRTMIPEQC